MVICLAALYGMASQQIDSWLGKWEFVESWPTIDRKGVEFVQYELILRRESGKLVCDLDMDGHMTLRRIRADCVTVGNGINVVFSESRQDDQNGSHLVKGDVLFRLERSQKGILTVWRKLRPTVPEHDKTGIYFKRTSERDG